MLSEIDYTKYDPIVRSAVNTYLDLLDRNFANERIDVYLIGSIALADFRKGKSDVDFVTVKESPWHEASLEKLATLHKELSRQVRYPLFDGIYLTYADLRSNPRQVSAPHSQGNKFQRANALAANPITWHTLKNRALIVRGKPAIEVSITDEELADWCRWNVNTYWGDWVNRLERRFPYNLYGLSGDVIVWGVLGIPRLHATITTNEIISKTKAAAYAKQVFDTKWHGIIDEAISIRTEGKERYINNPFARRREAIEFIRYVNAECLN